MSDDVTVRRDGEVLVLTLDRPDKKNALTNAMYRSLGAAIEAADADAAIGAILLTGSGGAFTAGNDIKDFLAVLEGEAEEIAGHAFIRRIASAMTPIVAAVDGVAIGVGTTMLLHCDLVYATPAAFFRMPFVDLGLVPEAASSLLIPQRFGMQKAAEWLLLGTGFAAGEAHHCGLVNAVVPADALFDHAMDAARRLAAKPRAALQATRQLLRGDRSAILARIEQESHAFDAALRSDDARRAFASFLAKAKP